MRQKRKAKKETKRKQRRIEGIAVARKVKG